MSKVIVYGRNKRIFKLDSLMALQTVCLAIVAYKFMLSRDNGSRIDYTLVTPSSTGSTSFDVQNGAKPGS